MSAIDVRVATCADDRWPWVIRLDDGKVEGFGGGDPRRERGYDLLRIRRQLGGDGNRAVSAVDLRVATRADDRWPWMIRLVEAIVVEQDMDSSRDGWIVCAKSKCCADVAPLREGRRPLVLL